MVLWEIAAVTAYFLGLKRSYKHALRLQRRVISPQYPKIREFAYRRTRGVFDIAVTVHKSIQERDIEVGRNVGNWILRWLDRMKPAAEIRPHPRIHEPLRASTGAKKTLEIKKTNIHSADQETGGHKLFSPLNFRAKYFPTISANQETGVRQLFSPLNFRAKYFPNISAMMQQRKVVGVNVPHRHVSYCSHSQGILRRDVAQWIVHN